MKSGQIKPLGAFIEERTERLRSKSATIYSVTNERGFVRSLDLFDKQVFSADTGNYKCVGFNDLAYNPSRINVGSVAMCEDKEGGAVSPMYVIIRTKPELLPRYLLHFLKSDTGLHQIHQRCEGAVRFQLKFRDLCAIPFFVPSLAEQERILKLVDAAQDLHEVRTEANHRTAALLPAIFHEMFGQHITSPPVVTSTVGLKAPREWRWKQLTEVGRLATGHTPSRRHPEWWGGEIPWLSLTDIRELDGKIATATGESVNEDGIANSSSVKLPKGTVCFSRTASVGFVTVMGREMATSQDFVNWVCGPEIDPIYLMGALMQAREYLRSLASGSTHKTIYFPTVKQFATIVPPLPLQKEFAQRVTEIRELEAKQAASRQRLESLFQSMLHRAFNGEI